MSSFGFKYAEPLHHLMLIQTIGYQKVTDTDYCWNGLNRAGSGLLFQYTLSGRGELEVAGQHYALTQDHAFAVSIPGEHRYYYSSGSIIPWEFIWIRFSGTNALQLWQEVENRGPVMEFNSQEGPITLLWQIYHDVLQNKLREPTQQSIRLYEWLLSLLYGERGRKQREGEDFKEPCAKAVMFMREHYAEPLMLEQIAACENLSKHHFCKRFHKELGVTPMIYLNRIRTEEAASLLVSTQLSVQRVAQLTGFDNASYFGKVFTRFVGMSPSRYRESRHEQAVSHLKLV